jgi:hypothetical protein
MYLKRMLNIEINIEFFREIAFWIIRSIFEELLGISFKITLASSCAIQIFQELEFFPSN